MTIHIAVITTTRADFGLLAPLIEKLNSALDFRLSLIATGTHLSAIHGHTVDEIVALGFTPDYKIPIDLSNDGRAALTSEAGVLTGSFAELFESATFDAIVVLGDRFEIIPPVFAATMLGIKVIHIHGGEITLGALDNKFRYAVSSMADLHLAPTRVAAERLILGGAIPKNVIFSGAPGVENALSITLASALEIKERTGMELAKRNLLFTFHPETVSSTSVEDQIRITLEALSAFPETGKFISTPNADPESQIIRYALRDFAAQNPRCYFTENLGHHLYLSLLSVVDVVVGNSSSGIIEAPALGTMTVNIGDRQKGREQAPSIINADYKAHTIIKAIHTGFDESHPIVIEEHPYYHSNSSSTMLNAIKAFLV